MAFEPKTIFDSDDGNSPIYMGISYLKILAAQIDLIRQAAREAYNYVDEKIFFWYNELRVFYDLVENRTGLDNSTKKIKTFEFNTDWTFKDIEIEEKDKYEHWFLQIEAMFERNAIVQEVTVTNKFQSAKYKNNKKITLELSRCFRELMRDANLKHLIMPEGQKNMKDLTKDEWIDRDFKKEF